MPYVVSEDCIKCKYMDCVNTCPVHCFYEGENMLVIAQDECIDCAACEPVCPISAIMSDADQRASDWIALNAQFAKSWPRIVRKGDAPPDAKQWEGKPNKFAQHFSPAPGKCHLQT